MGLGTPGIALEMCPLHGGPLPTPRPHTPSAHSVPAVATELVVSSRNRTDRQQWWRMREVEEPALAILRRNFSRLCGNQIAWASERILSAFELFYVAKELLLENGHPAEGPLAQQKPDRPGI